MNIKSLLSVLKERKFTFRYSGPSDTEIYSCAPFSCRLEKVPGILYFAGYGEFREVSENSDIPHNKTNDISLLESDPACLTAVQALLLSFSRREQALIELHMEMAQDHSLIKEISLCEQVMENPVILMREDFSPLAWQGFTSNNDFSELQKIDKTKLLTLLEVQGITKLEASGCLGSRWLAGFLRYDGKKSRFLFVKEVRHFDAATDSDIMHKLCSILSNTSLTERISLSDKDSQREKVIGSLFYGRPHHPETVRQLLYELGFEKKEKYYLLLVERNDSDGREIPASRLYDILKRPIYSHENYYVCILDSPKNKEYSMSDFKELNAFFCDACIYAGLSYGFFDITKLSDAIWQAKAAIHVTKAHDWNRYYSIYSDVIVSEMVVFCSENGNRDLRSYCHPDVLRILHYDKEYGTDFLSFLYVYLMSGMSVKRTGKALSLHKNTVYQRLDKLKYYFGIDFDDVYLMIKLYVSTVALTFNKELDPNIFYLFSNDNDDQI